MPTAPPAASPPRPPTVRPDRLLVSFFALAACAPPYAAPKADGEAPGDSAEPGDTGPKEDCALPAPEARLLDVETVVEVSWPDQGDWSAVARDDRGRTLQTRGGRDATRTLVGFAERAQVEVRVETDAGCSPWVALETGVLPAALPVIRRLDAGGAAADGYLLATVQTPTGSWVAALDEEGATVYAAPVNPVTEEVGTIGFRALPSPDGRGLRVNLQALKADGPSAFVTLGWDGAELERLEIAGAHTDFLHTRDGGIATLGWEVIQVGDRRLLGDTLIEQGPDGVTRELWRVSDDFSPDLRRSYPTGFLAGDPTMEDWSHANGIGYDEVNDLYLVSLPFLNGVVAIDRRSGERRWTLAPGDPDWRILGDDEDVWWPHSVTAVDGGVLMFQRRDPTDLSTCSRAAQYALDDATHEATLVWTYEGPRCHQVGFLGNVEELPGGDRLISWSQYGELERVSEDGDQLLLLGLDVGAGFGFVSWVPALGDVGDVRGG